MAFYKNPQQSRKSDSRKKNAKVNYASRVNCQTSPLKFPLVFSSLPSFPCGLRAGERRRGATRSPVTLSSPTPCRLPPTYSSLSVPSSCPRVRRVLAALSQRLRPPPTGARAAGAPPSSRRGGIRPLVFPSTPRSANPPGIWICFSCFLVRRPNLACFGCFVLPACGRAMESKSRFLGWGMLWGGASVYLNSNRVLLFLSISMQS